MDFTVIFTNQSEEPIFDKHDWTLSFLEKNASLTAELPEAAHYEQTEPETGIFYYVANEVEDRIKVFFHVDEHTGELSLLKELDYETDEYFEFQIVASNLKTKDRSNNPKSYLRVNVTVCKLVYLKIESISPLSMLVRFYQSSTDSPTTCAFKNLFF